MEVNNEFYETLGNLWWSDAADFDFTSLRYGVNPLRFAYFERQLAKLGASGKTLLDVGCGGGYLSEEFAKRGYDVTGVDPAANPVARPASTRPGAAYPFNTRSDAESRYRLRMRRSTLSPAVMYWNTWTT